MLPLTEEILKTALKAEPRRICKCGADRPERTGDNELDILLRCVLGIVIQLSTLFLASCCDTRVDEMVLHQDIMKAFSMPTEPDRLVRHASSLFAMSLTAKCQFDILLSPSGLWSWWQSNAMPERWGKGS